MLCTINDMLADVNGMAFGWGGAERGGVRQTDRGRERPRASENKNVCVCVFARVTLRVGR